MTPEQINDTVSAKAAALPENTHRCLVWTGKVKIDQTRQELYPNPHNPNLMDVREVTRYSGEYRETYETRIGRKRTITVWFFVHEESAIVEEGAYWDRR